MYLGSLFVLSVFLFGIIGADPAPAASLDEDELSELLSQYYNEPVEDKRSSLPNLGGYRRHYVPGKRVGAALPNLGVYSRPSLADYMRLAALESELDNASVEEPSIDGEQVVEPEGHAVDKRRSRYGFWVTAINKMDNNHLRGFLGKHRNVYNVYKRSADSDAFKKEKKAIPFVPALGNSA